MGFEQSEPSDSALRAIEKGAIQPAGDQELAELAHDTGETSGPDEVLAPEVVQGIRLASVEEPVRTQPDPVAAKEAYNAVANEIAGEYKGLSQDLGSARRALEGWSASVHRNEKPKVDAADLAAAQAVLDRLKSYVE